MSKLHYKKDGTLDMRYKSSKEFINSQQKLESPDLQNEQPQIISQTRPQNIKESPKISPKAQSPKKKASNTSKQTKDDTSLIDSPIISRDISDPPQTYISPALSLNPNELYNSSDIKLTQKGTIDRSSKAVKLGDILFNADGTVDRHSYAVLTGRLVLNSEGNPDTSIHTDIQIPKNPGEYKTSVYRDKYQQKKFRKETNCPKDYDASHIVDLELARDILKSKPGRHPTEAELRQSMKPLNKLLEASPQNVNRQNKSNPENNRESAQRIIKIIRGEYIIRTRALDQKIIQMKEALHSIPQDEMNPQIKYIMKEIDRIAPINTE